MATAKFDKNLPAEKVNVNKLALSDNISVKNVIDEKKFNVSNDVVGLLQYNTDIRNNALIKNAGKYPLYEGILSPAIGEVSTITTRFNQYLVKNGLLEYTHNVGSKNANVKNEYADYINNMYFQCGNKEVYENKTLLQPWTADYCNYIQYIDEVLGEDCISFHINLINGLLANQFTDSFLRINEVGVVRDFQINAAMAGAVTTNVTNFSGTDTKLGLITNQIYSHSLYQGSAFNSTRMANTLHIGDYNVQKRYITPSLYNQYGNNSSTVFRLAEILRLNDGEQFVREDLGGHVRFNDLNDNYAGDFIVMQYDESEKYLTERGFTNKTYFLEKGMHYVNGEMNEETGRYIDNSHLFGYNAYTKSSDELYASPIYGTYSEGDIAGSNSGASGLASEVQNGELYETIYDTIEDSLISKTNRLFNEHKISTMIGRFHTTLNDGNGITDEIEMIDSAKSKGYGNSHGRNLLKLDARTKTSENNTNGYDNPYCRTWTYHHQYNQLKKMIRPFIDNKGEAYTLAEIQKMNMKNRSYMVGGDDKLILNGAEKLGRNSVLQDNGFVRITPQGGESGKSIKDCMFSIENLAWKDFTTYTSDTGIKMHNKRVISQEQTGPNGGRIMWFPPYDLDFQESVNVSWNENSFIGRGENVYTYKNTTRTGTLSFSLLIDHPSIINKYVKDCGDGMGEDKDPHADLLRFFAGCEFLKGEVKVDEPEKPNTPPENQGPPEETIKIRVYFPNNFSGIYGTDKVIYEGFDKFITDSGNTALASGDAVIADYWWRYLLVGNTTTIPSDESKFVGYEMRSGGTTTLTEKTGINVVTEKKALHVCRNQVGENSILGAGAIECKIDGRVKNVYHYYVDEDMHNNAGSDNSFKDMETFGFNSVISNEERGENEYSFAELMYALLIYNNSIFKDKEYTEKYKNYLKEKIKISIDKASELKELFENSAVTYTNITVQGGASKNGYVGKNKVLSERRAWVIKDLLKRTILKGNTDESVLTNREGFITGEKNLSASSKNNKIARSSILSITFTRSQSENVSDGTTNEQEETLKGFITLDKFKEVLIESSDVIKILSETKGVDLDDLIDKSEIWEDNKYPKEGWESETKIYHNEDGIGINDVLNKFFEKNNTIDEYIKLAYSISVEPVFDEFMSKVNSALNSSKNLNDNNPEVKKLKEECNKIQEEITGLEKEIEDLTIKKEKLIEKQDELLQKLPDDNAPEDESSINVAEDANTMKEINNIEKEINQIIKKIYDINNKLTKKSGEYDEKYKEYIESLKKNAELSEDERMKQISKSLPIIQNNVVLLADFRVILDGVIPRIHKQKYTGNETITLTDGTKFNFKDKDLTEIELKYEDLIKEYDNLIRNNEAKKSEVRKITKQIRKTGKVQQNLLSKIYSDEEIVYTGNCITYNDGKVKYDNNIVNFFTEDDKNEISAEIANFYKTDKDYSEEIGHEEKGVAINFESKPINIKYIDERLDEYAKKVDLLTEEEKDIENKNNLDSGATLSFMYITGTTVNDNKASDEKDKFTASGYAVERFNFNDDGTGIYNPITIDGLSYNKLFKHYLLIDYVTDKYGELYGDNLYLFFEVIKEKNDDVGIQELENNLLYVFENKTVCCENDDCSKCTNIAQAEGIEQDIEKLFNEVIIGGEGGVDAKIEQKEQDEQEDSEKEVSQNITENNESLEDKLEREQQEELNAILKWAQYDVSKYNNRYETEAEYFKKLETKDPFTYRNLKEKFKYFNPAFHAITPEGFNARLTFLQQCTRQGSTSEKNGINNYGITSNNLAFGRMPVCVLRIGDFIHTRIIIQSISINYGANGAMQWDLNPEGAGVQPMYAKVSMNIVLIGGQSLETPISRLQNALSFNYYANTESYDNRADSAIYNNRSVEYKYVFDPMNTEESKLSENDDKMIPAEELSDITTTQDNVNKTVSEKTAQEELDKASGTDVVDNGYKKGRINRPRPGVDSVSWELYGYLTNVLPSNLGLKITNQQENIIIEYEVNESSKILTVKTVDLSKYNIELKKNNSGDLNTLIEKYKNEIITTINTGKTQGQDNNELIKRLISTVTK